MGIPALELDRIVRWTACLAAVALALALNGCGPKSSTKGAGATGATTGQPTVTPGAKPGAPATSPGGGATPQESSPSPSADTGSDFTGPDIGSIAIVSQPGANGGTAIDVDFVVALDAAAAAEIGALGAEDWFAKREGLVAAEKADVMSWRVEAGGNVPETPVDSEDEAAAIFVFAHYAGAGSHRKKIEGEGALTITLGATDFTIDVAQ